MQEVEGGVHSHEAGVCIAGQGKGRRRCGKASQGAGATWYREETEETSFAGIVKGTQAQGEVVCGAMPMNIQQPSLNI